MAGKLTEILDKRVSQERLTQAEADLISSFIFEVQAQRGTRDSGMMTRAWALIRTAEALHQFHSTLDTATTEDALRMVSFIRGNGYSKNYQNDIIKALKRFLLWRIDNGARKLNEKKIRAIKPPGMDWACKKPEDMLTKDEVLQVIEACGNSRDKAIISMLYDASARPVDLRELTWDDIIFDEYGALIHTSAKTGIPRSIRLTHISFPYLAQWRQDYPGSPKGLNPVFLSHRVYEAAGGQHVPIEHTAFLRLIRSLRKKTGIQKLKPSIFRSTRITHDVADGYDTAYLMKKNWGTLKTNMLEIYAKPDEDYITRYALEKSGVELPKKIRERSKVLDPITCIHCSWINPPGTEYCGHCGRPLDEKTATELASLVGAVEDTEMYRVAVEAAMAAVKKAQQS